MRLKHGYRDGVPDLVNTAWGCSVPIRANGVVVVSSAQVDMVGASSDRDALAMYLDARVGVAWAREAERLLAAGQMPLGEEHILIDQGGVVVKATMVEDTAVSDSAPEGTRTLHVCAYAKPETADKKYVHIAVLQQSGVVVGVYAFATALDCVRFWLETSAPESTNFEIPFFHSAADALRAIQTPEADQTRKEATDEV